MMGGMVYSTSTYQANLENEDRYLVKDIPIADSQIKVYAVFDGHGGHDCSSFLEQELSRELEKAARRASKHKDLDKRELKRVLMTSFKEVDEQFLEKRDLKPTSGSCALCACFYRNWVFFANVGDSRAVLGTFEESPSQQQNGAIIKARVMTQDQDASNQRERKAVSRRTTDLNPIRPSSSSGPLRVAGSLMVTRAIGDAYLKLKDRSFTPYNRHVPYITSAPIITTHCINPGKDRFVVIATDGLFNWMSNDDVVEVVSKYLDEGGDPSDAAHHLIEWTLCQRVCPAMGFTIDHLRKLPRGERRLVHDDITVVVVTLPTSLETSDLMDETLSLPSPSKYSDLIESDSEFDAEDDFGLGLRTSSISSTSTELADCNTTVRLNFSDIHLNAEDLLANIDDDEVGQSPHYDNHEELDGLVIETPIIDEVVLSQIEDEAIMEALRDIHEVSKPGDVFTVDVQTELVSEDPPHPNEGSNRKSPKKRKQKPKWTKRKRSSSNKYYSDVSLNNQINIESQLENTIPRSKRQKKNIEVNNIQTTKKKRSTKKKRNRKSKKTNS